MHGRKIDATISTRQSNFEVNNSGVPSRNLIHLAFLRPSKSLRHFHKVLEGIGAKICLDEVR